MACMHASHASGAWLKLITDILCMEPNIVGPETCVLNKLCLLNTGKDQAVELATKVMQFALVTDRGFRFALAHFPVSSLTPATLLEKFWEGVEWCLKANFR